MINQSYVVFLLQVAANPLDNTTNWKMWFLWFSIHESSVPYLTTRWTLATRSW